MSNPKNYIGNK